MSGLSPTLIVGIGGLVIGLVFGAVVQRTNFCTMGSISDLMLMGNWNRFRAWLLTIAIAMLVSHVLFATGRVDLTHGSAHGGSQ